MAGKSSSSQRLETVDEGEVDDLACFFYRPARRSRLKTGTATALVDAVLVKGLARLVPMVCFRGRPGNVRGFCPRA